MNNENTLHKYDRKYGNILDVSLKTKPSTIKIIEPLTGRTETFILQTLRHEGGNYTFIEIADEEGLTRIVLPPKVSRVLLEQNEALTKQSRSRAAKLKMADRIAAGEVINFQRKKQA
jgi:hypothetical protein